MIITEVQKRQMETKILLMYMLPCIKLQEMLALCVLHLKGNSEAHKALSFKDMNWLN